MEASKGKIGWKQLDSRISGSRILVPGQPNEVRQKVLYGLRCINESMEAGFEVTEKAERMQPEDYVILFPGFEGSGSAASRLENGLKSREDMLHGFLCLTEQLEQIRTTKPRAVLLMSDTCVYGKVFGMPHALKEEETGYVCHTDSRDMGVQCMRMAEHLCARLAREEGIPVKIARVDRRVLMEIEDSRNDGKELQTGRIPGGELLEAMLRVLLDGVPGEAYNLPGSGECRLPESREDEGMNQKETSGIPDEEGHSALSPIRIVPDCGKAGRL